MKTILKMIFLSACALGLFSVLLSCEADTCTPTDGILLSNGTLIDSEDACCNYAYERDYKYYCYKNGECYGYRK